MNRVVLSILVAVAAAGLTLAGVAALSTGDNSQPEVLTVFEDKHEQWFVKADTSPTQPMCKVRWLEHVVESKTKAIFENYSPQRVYVSGFDSNTLPGTTEFALEAFPQPGWKKSIQAGDPTSANGDEYDVGFVEGTSCIPQNRQRPRMIITQIEPASTPTAAPS